MATLLYWVARLVRRPWWKRQNNPFAHFKTLHDGTINLEPYLHAFHRSATTMREEFSVTAWKGTRHLFHPSASPESEWIFRDTNYGFVLCYGLAKNFAACIGFEPKKNALVIRQIQGVPGVRTREVLESLRWEKMLVELVVDWARTHGFLFVKIERAEANWYWDTVSPEHRQRMKIRYNVTARRCGFNEDPSNSKFFVRAITPR